MTETDNSAFGDSVYQANEDDAEYLDPAETLTGDDLDEPLDTGYNPPDHRPVATRFGTTEAEQVEGESLDQRLAQEEPDPSTDYNGDFPWSDNSADPRAGRLVQPDEGAHPDLESDAIAFDAGRAGNASSAEEAAMHVVDDDDLDPDYISEETLSREP